MLGDRFRIGHAYQQPSGPQIPLQQPDLVQELADLRVVAA
jgi:hypothetical protein